ncbi:hypothetical protein MA9V1_207 [Chryseobacterium phage MA9V-1]|nr:hypothetical protein MA9V1_207 [Chryseobacterium phage MA9V-1]
MKTFFNFVNESITNYPKVASTADLVAALPGLVAEKSKVQEGKLYNTLLAKNNGSVIIELQTSNGAVKDATTEVLEFYAKVKSFKSYEYDSKMGIFIVQF